MKIVLSSHMNSWHDWWLWAAKKMIDARFKPMSRRLMAEKGFYYFHSQCNKLHIAGRFNSTANGEIRIFQLNLSSIVATATVRAPLRFWFFFFIARMHAVLAFVPRLQFIVFNWKTFWRIAIDWRRFVFGCTGCSTILIASPRGTSSDDNSKYTNMAIEQKTSARSLFTLMQHRFNFEQINSIIYFHSSIPATTRMSETVCVSECRLICCHQPPV